MQASEQELEDQKSRIPIPCEGKKPNVLKAFQFLEMIDNILPPDHEKVRRIALEKTIPKLLLLQKQQDEISATREPYNIVEHTRKLKAIQKQAQPYVRELLLTKLVTDFRL